MAYSSDPLLLNYHLFGFIQHSLHLSGLWCQQVQNLEEFTKSKVNYFFYDGIHNLAGR